MSNTRNRVLILAVALAVVVTACDGRPKCAPPPGGFSEADLVGTWIAGLPILSDALVFRSDGTYKQMIHIDGRADYASNWQRWWLEYRESGIPYLYLEGMSLCGFNPDISCSEVGDGGYDYCEDRSLHMTNGVILLVLGVKEPLFTFPSDNFRPDMQLLFPTLDHGWMYFLQEP